MKRVVLSIVAICLFVSLTAAPARAHWNALGGFIAGTFVGAALAPRVVYAAPVYAEPAYVVPPRIYVPGHYSLRYDDCGHRRRVWVPSHYRYARY